MKTKIEIRLNLNSFLLCPLYTFLVFLLVCETLTSISTSNYISSSTSCMNISIRNSPYGQIHSLNFFTGQSQPPNVSCSWTIHPVEWSLRTNYIFSVRVLELENDPTRWSNELTFWTGARQISLDDVKNRTYAFFNSTSSIQIYFRTRAPLLQTYNPYIRTNLRIRRLSIEFFHFIQPELTDDKSKYFRCLSSGILIPESWRCNCIRECPDKDDSDEKDCPLCSMYEPTTSILCQSNEIWCLPTSEQSPNDILLTEDIDENVWMQSHRRYSQKIEPKGVCIPPTLEQSCIFSTNHSKCQVVLTRTQDQGQILLNTMLLNSYESLCFVIVAKEEHKIKMIVNQYQSLDSQLSDFEWRIYDGVEEQNQLLLSSSHFLSKQMVQTRQHHIATMIVRRLSAFLSIDQLIHSYVDEDVLGHMDSNWTQKPRGRRSIDVLLLNLTWFTSICSDDQMLCSGNFETKCYTADQRCDGVWNCISGDDELGCSPESCPTTFACNDHLHASSDQPRCFTWSERCNGNSLCVNRTDERFCTNWWCNSNNGTFLCKNLNCIYEAWVCDGADDCGDRSDEINCPSRVPRRIVTAAVIGATVCSTLFIIALGCTCKLFHLRTSERRATSRLLNPQRYIEQRRQQSQRTARPQSTVSTNDSPTTVPNDPRRIAPPSYNQTMGLVDENEERHAALAEHLRLAGLANYISMAPIHTNTRSSRSSSRHRHRRHRRHRHHQHHHHNRRAHSEGSRVALLEPSVVVPNTAFTQPSNSFTLNQLNRFRSQLRSLFATITTDQSARTTLTPRIEPTSTRRHRTRATATQTSEHDGRPLASINLIHARELPPPYTEPSSAVNPICHNTTDASETDPNHSSRFRKREFPIHSLRDRMRQFISGSSVRIGLEESSHPMQPTSLMALTTTATVTHVLNQEEIDDAATRTIVPAGDDEQRTSDDDKMLTP